LTSLVKVNDVRSCPFNTAPWTAASDAQPPSLAVEKLSTPTLSLPVATAHGGSSAAIGVSLSR